MVVFKTGFIYSCGSDVDGSAVLCSAAGRACFESAFPVLHSGIFWADCCADSDYCEVSFSSFSAPCIDYFLRFRFLCILAAVGCCCIFDGLVILEVCLDKCYFHLLMMIKRSKMFYFVVVYFC